MAQKPKRGPYVALPTAAKRLGCSLPVAIGLIHNQQLRAKLSGGLWWVERESLDAFIRRYGRRPGAWRAA